MVASPFLILTSKMVVPDWPPVVLSCAVEYTSSAPLRDTSEIQNFPRDAIEMVASPSRRRSKNHRAELCSGCALCGLPLRSPRKIFEFFGISRGGRAQLVRRTAREGTTGAQLMGTTIFLARGVRGMLPSPQHHQEN